MTLDAAVPGFQRSDKIRSSVTDDSARRAERDISHGAKKTR
jgi:hypothetical protein